jgi:hypothetical protein
MSVGRATVETPTTAKHEAMATRPNPPRPVTCAAAAKVNARFTRLD